MEVERPIERIFPLSALTVFVLAIAMLTAIIIVLSVATPHWLEITVRTLANLIGVLGAPALVILGYRDWTKRNRAKLPLWRNGLGLAAMVMLLGVWIMDPSRPYAQHHWSIHTQPL